MPLSAGSSLRISKPPFSLAFFFLPSVGGLRGRQVVEIGTHKVVKSPATMLSKWDTMKKPKRKGHPKLSYKGPHKFSKGPWAVISPEYLQTLVQPRANLSSLFSNVGSRMEKTPPYTHYGLPKQPQRTNRTVCTPAIGFY